MKTVIPFDISYRDKVERGDVEVTTYDGRRVKILQWDVNSDKPIVAVVQRDIPDTGKDTVVCYSKIGTQQNGVGPSDLTMVVGHNYAEKLIKLIYSSEQFALCLHKHGFDVSNLIAWLEDIRDVENKSKQEFKVGDILRRKTDGVEGTVIDITNEIITVRTEDWVSPIYPDGWELIKECLDYNQSLYLDENGVPKQAKPTEFTKGFCKGYNFKENKIMNDAIDAEIIEVEDDSCTMNIHTHLEISIDDDYLENNFKNGDKVKLIILKDQ